MIIEWFIERWRDMFVTVLGWFSPEDFEVPDFFANFDQTVNDVLAAGGVLIAWFEWVGMLAVYGSGLAAKTLRAIAAHVPFVGGAG